MLTEFVIRFCSPTLAGLKVSNLFSCKYTDIMDIENEVERLNKLLNIKGIFFRILRTRDNIALIYVYRKSKLRDTLNCKHVRGFLETYGYEKFQINDCISLLQEHLVNEDFPHEIGIFLGYPLSDVIAFIENKGKHSKHTGCWKVYTNEEEAKKIFARFDKCTEVYRKCFGEGSDLIKLAIAR
ncbi:MAG: hypothetical protein BEN19_04405 [Epulopiscium sp. Nuni2H_MBin003]|nr:MAG: hypothetical protein BEN19_04405 [Epulopiscium sp. Nuni2H_MBin003]